MLKAAVPCRYVRFGRDSLSIRASSYKTALARSCSVLTAFSRSIRELAKARAGVNAARQEAADAFAAGGLPVSTRYKPAESAASVESLKPF
jgi:hypothetical protein